MPRTDNDTWDLASRASGRPPRWSPPRAPSPPSRQRRHRRPVRRAPLVRAVGVDFFTRLATGELRPPDLDSGDTPVGIGQFVDGMAARTRFFDDFFADAGRAGIRQAVILASGLDARAYRLDWPARHRRVRDRPARGDRVQDTHEWPISAPSRPHELHTVAVDLRQDWPAALAEAGFDSRDRPTAWIAEGLFGYLPPEAQDRLFDQIDRAERTGQPLGAEGVSATAAISTTTRSASRCRSAPTSGAPTGSTSISPTWSSSATGPR